MLFLPAAAAGALLTMAQAADAASASHGQMLFRSQCAMCHAAGAGDGDGGFGPSLKGVVGRKPAGDPTFAYTPALREAKGPAWTEESLAAFLADPQKVAPGTAMPIRVDSAADRTDIAAYLGAVK